MGAVYTAPIRPGSTGGNLLNLNGLYQELTMLKSIKKSDLKSQKISQLKISLKEVEPEIWRRLLIPLNYNLENLHKVIQAAMGWQNSQETQKKR